MAKQVFFYATPSDLKELIQIIESQNSLTYHLAGLLEKENIAEYASLLNAPSLGNASAPDKDFCDRFVVLYSKNLLNIREVEQSRGGIKYAIDQLKNPTSILFSPCGIYDSENMIIEGNVGTVSADKESLEIFNIFNKTIKKTFLKFKNVFLGKGAHELYTKGWRLTPNKNLSNNFDFNID